MTGVVGAASPLVMGGVAAFLLCMLLIGTFTIKLVGKSGSRYIVAGHSLPLFFVGSMLAAQAIDGNGSLGNAGIVYSSGFWAGASIPLGIALCLLLTALFFGARLNKMAMITLPDFYYRRYGSRVEGVTGGLLIVSFVVLVAGNFAATGFIMREVFGVPFVVGMIIAVSIVLTYTFAGGLFSAAYTDIFQIYIAVFALWATFLYFALGFAGVSMTEFIDNMPGGTMDFSGLTSRENGALVNWATILALGLGNVVALDFMERVFSARNPRTARRGAFWGGTLTLLVVVPASMIGVFAFTLLPGLEDPFLALPQLAVQEVPTPIGILLLSGVLGASMSTSNGGALAITSVIARNLVQRDLLGNLLKRPPLDDAMLLRLTRLMLFPVMAAGLILAWRMPQPGHFLVLAFDLVFAGAFAPLMFGLFWSKSNTPAALASLFIGTTLRIIGFFVTPAAWEGLETLIPPVISAVVFVAVALSTQRWESGIERHGVVDYVPPEQDVIEGADLRNYVPPTAPAPVPVERPGARVG